jgi:hypothetical protein
MRMASIVLAVFIATLAGCEWNKPHAQLEREWFECGLAARQVAGEQGRSHDAAGVQDEQDRCFAQKNPKDAYHGTTVRRDF